ncbi:hypothetical protein LTR09_000811 [Extremus antarcticus]|uniref:F-box domain-containing protein n=1 Tax=Extremus antarcticus TaxID=702011 RepID=A0AAJ0GKB0_9PEZI|nr:hypothetical protein LTR09_000811 [Extremus antarcticus]
MASQSTPPTLLSTSDTGIEGVSASLSANYDAPVSRDLRELIRLFKGDEERAVNATSPQLAAQVFAIPELLENILSHLPSVDLLQAHSVGHAFAGAIDGSRQLQTQLGLHAQHDVRPYSPAAFIRGWRFEFDGFHSLLDVSTTGDQKDNTHFPMAMRKPLQNLGNRCGLILISQPPARTLKVFSSCCHPANLQSIASHSRSLRRTKTHKDLLSAT